MKCKYLKTRSKNKKYYGYCTKDKIEVSLYCNKCKDEIYNQYKEKMQKKKVRVSNPIRKTSNKQNKRQNKRYSIIYPDLKKCAYCGYNRSIELNEVFEGKNRQASMLNGFIVPLCHNCHTMFHNNREFSLYYKKMFQKEYEKSHTREDFIKLIGRNYL